MMNAKLHPKLMPLTDVKAEAVNWLWPGRIPLGKVTLLVGDPGLGKSFIAADISARVSHADSTWPDGGDVPHGDAIILSSEDSPSDTIRPRIEAMGGDVNRVHVLRTGVVLPTPTELEALCAGGEVRVIVLDPLVSFVGKMDPWKDTEVRRVMDPLAVVAAKASVAIIGIMHMTKDSDRVALYRASGSVAFVAASRAAHVVVKDPEDDERRVLASIKFNLGPKPSALAYRIGGSPAVVQWEPEPVEEFDVDTVMAKLANANQHDRRREGPKLAQAVVFMRQFLAVGPRAVKDVMMAAKAVGIAEQTLRRAAEKLGVKQHNPGTGQVWELPPSQPLPHELWPPLVVVEGSTTIKHEELQDAKSDNEVAVV